MNAPQELVAGRSGDLTVEAGVGEPELVRCLALAVVAALRDRRLELCHGLVGRVRAASPASGTSSWMRASTSSTNEMLSVSSMVAMDSLRLRPIPSFCVLATKTPPPGPREARMRCELASSLSASRSVGRLTPNSVASSLSVPSRSSGRRSCCAM